jgi:release factor glutamine methyltransferase
MNVKIQTIKNIRLLLARELKPVYPPEEVNSLTNIILKTCLNTDWLHHLTEPDRLVEENVVKRIISITGELKTGKPIQYILGETEFYNCRLKLNNNTLIPRQETEELVDLIIRENHGYKGNILDLGTGSGCIAIALARNIPGSEITAIDNSLEALKIAEQNAMLNNVSIEFRNIDIMDTGQNHMLADFGIIVSNPPYVLESEKVHMHSNILDFEPSDALFVPDDDPLVYYRKILELSDILLKPGGRIYFEINESMGSTLRNIMSEAAFSDLAIIMDINGKDRIIKGRYNG